MLAPASTTSPHFPKNEGVNGPLDEDDLPSITDKFAFAPQSELIDLKLESSNEVSI